MGKPLIKSLTVIAAGSVAIVICLFGYYTNNRRQHEQRITYAETAIINQKDTLTNLSKEAAGLYSTEEKIFLKPEVTKNELSNLSSKLSSVKLSADDYGISKSELPHEAAAVQAKKEKIVNQLKDAEAKLKIQESINELFTEKVSNWQQATDDVIIKENVKSDRIAKLRENVSFFEESPWKTMITQYLGFADAQITQVTELDKLFDTMLKDEQVTAGTTYDQYLTALNQIEQIRNEKIKEKYTAMAGTVAQQMGYSSFAY